MRALVPVLPVPFLLAACAATPMDSSADIPRDRTCAFQGMTLHYLEQGTGELSVVLVHAWGGAAGVWRHNLGDLAEHCRVLAVDLPGHGGSDAPEIDYPAELMARSIAAVMDERTVNAPCSRATATAEPWPGGCIACSPNA